MCATALLVASGVSHRLWTGEWAGANTEPALFAARLTNVPATFGEWQGTDQEIGEAQLKTTEATGYVMRDYVRSDTGDRVSIMILCGRPGPMCVHQPTVCYGGRGFEKEKETPYHIQGTAEVQEADFNRLDLIKRERGSPERLRIYYGWNSQGEWRAPADPRLAFGGTGALYKMYVVFRPAPGSPLTESDPCQDFLRDLLPELQRALSPAS
jgi:hypothetical protein